MTLVYNIIYSYTIRKLYVIKYNIERKDVFVFVVFFLYIWFQLIEKTNKKKTIKKTN